MVEIIKNRGIVLLRTVRFVSSSDLLVTQYNSRFPLHITPLIAVFKYGYLASLSKMWFSVFSCTPLHLIIVQTSFTQRLTAFSLLACTVDIPVEQILLTVLSTVLHTDSTVTRKDLSCLGILKRLI